MPRFRHETVEIAFLDEGEGEPIVLVHGFASNRNVNWVQPGWVATLTRAGRRVIAPDNRGHGESTKLYDPADYHTDRMAEDVRALMDHLGIERADVMGYSMGARIAAFLACKHPNRARAAILGGLGIHLVDGVGLPESIAEAKGSKTRAIVKMLGRGAIMLTAATFNLASWVFWALVNVLWLVVALKRAAEQATLRAVRKRKARRAAMRAAALAAAPVAG